MSSEPIPTYFTYTTLPLTKVPSNKGAQWARVGSKVESQGRRAERISVDHKYLAAIIALTYPRVPERSRKEKTWRSCLCLIIAWWSCKLKNWSASSSLRKLVAQRIVSVHRDVGASNIGFEWRILALRIRVSLNRGQIIPNQKRGTSILSKKQSRKIDLFISHCRSLIWKPPPHFGKLEFVCQDAFSIGKDCISSVVQCMIYQNTESLHCLSSPTQRKNGTPISRRKAINSHTH